MDRLRSFVTWWLAELAGLFPRGLLRALGLLPPVLTLECAAERLTVAFHHGERGARTEGVPFAAATPEALGDAVRKVLGHVPARKVSVELIVDQSRALRRTVRVPRAAPREIAGVVSFEIERHTPYRAGEVVYDWSIDPDASDERGLSVDLVMAPREIVARLIEGARAGGVEPDAIRVATGPASFADLPLDAAGIEPRRAGATVRWLAAAAVLLGFVAAAMPLVRQQQAISALEASVEQAKARALAAGRAGEDTARLHRTLEAVLEAKRAAPPVTRILDRLSAVLPDGTWLHHVSAVDGEVVIEGMTDRSTRLVKLLEASPLFRSVRYNAPVTRERGGRTERFSFALELARGGGS